MLIFICFFIIVNNYMYVNNNVKSSNTKSDNYLIDEINNLKRQVNDLNNNQNIQTNIQQDIQTDRNIQQYDLEKINNPLVDTVSRNSLLNYGYPYDLYRRVGILQRIEQEPIIKKKHQRHINYDASNDVQNYNGVEKKIITKEIIENFSNFSENNILQLFGMQSNVNTSIYFYYTIISDGNNSIKININYKNNNGSNEIYSGDIVYIPELNSSFVANIDSTIFMTYNPFGI